jgi:ubiquinone/menaquinone biosynthesis C-methylase UbiE
MLDGVVIDKKHLRMVLKYVHDMDKVIGECRRILKDEGQAIFVIGDCTLAGIFVKNSECLVSLAENHQLRLLSRIKRQIPGNRRYLPPPNLYSSGEMLQNRMSEEVILRFAI